MKGMLQTLAVVLLLSAAGPGLGCAGRVESESEAAADPALDEESASEEVAAARLNGDGTVADRLRDLSTATRIRKALVSESGLRRFDFEPVVSGGRVVLRGEVQTASQRDRAAEVARAVDGVRSLTNEVVASQAPTPPAVAETRPPEPAEPPADRPRADEEEPARDREEEPAPKPEAAAQPEATYHTVRSGESLWTISRRYDVTIDQITRLNNLRSNALKPGQKLRVK